MPLQVRITAVAVQASRGLHAAHTKYVRTLRRKVPYMSYIHASHCMSRLRDVRCSTGRKCTHAPPVIYVEAVRFEVLFVCSARTHTFIHTYTYKTHRNIFITSDTDSVYTELSQFSSEGFTFIYNRANRSFLHHEWLLEMRLRMALVDRKQVCCWVYRKQVCCCMYREII